MMYYMGYPIFLRNSDLESRFQDSLDFEEAWVVTRRPGWRYTSPYCQL